MILYPMFSGENKIFLVRRNLFMWRTRKLALLGDLAKKKKWGGKGKTTEYFR